MELTRRGNQRPPGYKYQICVATGCLEANREEVQERLRAVSRDGDCRLVCILSQWYKPAGGRKRSDILANQAYIEFHAFNTSSWRVGL